jgi:hypothetical protein
MLVAMTPQQQCVVAKRSVGARLHLGTQQRQGRSEIDKAASAEIDALWWAIKKHAEYKVELVRDATGHASEIHLPSAPRPRGDRERRYRITKTTASAYSADELDPETTDFAGSLSLDILNGDNQQDIVRWASSPKKLVWRP